MKATAPEPRLRTPPGEIRPIPGTAAPGSTVWPAAVAQGISRREKPGGGSARPPSYQVSRNVHSSCGRRLRAAGYSYAEIAAKLNISESSARVLEHRTRRWLQTTLQKEGLLNET